MSYITYTAPGIQPIQQAVVDLEQAAGSYDILEGNTASLVEVYAVYSAAPGAGLVSVSLQTDDDTPDVLLTAAEGALANLTGGKNLTFARTKPLVIPNGKKLQATIVGTGTGGSLIVLYKNIYGNVTQA